jgi:hypothetical protein
VLRSPHWLSPTVTPRGSVGPPPLAWSTSTDCERWVTLFWKVFLSPLDIAKPKWRDCQDPCMRLGQDGRASGQSYIAGVIRPDCDVNFSPHCKIPINLFFKIMKELSIALDSRWSHDWEYFDRFNIAISCAFSYVLSCVLLTIVDQNCCSELGQAFRWEWKDKCIA